MVDVSNYYFENDSKIVSHQKNIFNRLVESIALLDQKFSRRFKKKVKININH